MQKNDLIRKIRLISKFLTSHPGQQTITIHKLPNISRNKGNKAMKFGQVIKIARQIFFFKHHAENEPRKLVFLFFKKALYEVKASDLELGFNIFR